MMDEREQLRKAVRMIREHCRKQKECKSCVLHKDGKEKKAVYCIVDEVPENWPEIKEGENDT